MQRNTYLHCFTWNAEKSSKRPSFQQAPQWVCWGMCSTSSANLAGTTAEGWLCLLLVTEACLVDSSVTCRLAIATQPGQLLCPCLHLTLSCISNLLNGFQTLEEFWGLAQVVVTVVKWLPSTPVPQITNVSDFPSWITWHSPLTWTSVQVQICFEKFASEYVKFMLNSIYFYLIYAFTKHMLINDFWVCQYLSIELHYHGTKAVRRSSVTCSSWALIILISSHLQQNEPVAHRRSCCSSSTR